MWTRNLRAIISRTQTRTAFRSISSIRNNKFIQNRQLLNKNIRIPLCTTTSSDESNDKTVKRSVSRKGDVKHEQLVQKLMVLISQHSRRMTQDDAISEYLVKASELEKLESFEAPNPFSKSKESLIRWFRRQDVEKLSIKKWGSLAKMEMEKERRTFQRLRQQQRLKRQKTIKSTETFLTRIFQSSSKDDEKTDSKDDELSDQLHVVNVAIAGNCVVTLAKLFGFAISGSGSMLSEAVHSCADLANQFLLRIGITRSYLPSDAEHPYGYSLEQYVFGLVSGVGIFFLGCGATVYHGVSLMMNPHVVESLPTALAVLGTAGVVESYTLWVAIDAVRIHAANSQMKFWQYVRNGDNPVPVAVMLEDGAAVAGVVIAGMGLTMTHITGNVMYDAAGTIAVGTLLGGVAVMLITKNRSMLVGRSIDRKRLDQLKRVLMKDDVIDSLHDVKCISVGASDVRFKAEINFNGWRVAEKYIDKKIDISDAKGKLKRTSDIELFLLLFGDGLVQMLGDEIDRIEEIVRDHIPEAKHVDIEVL